jgi:hypothetical protein
MAFYEDLFKGDTGKGLAIGLGAAIVAPVALAALSGIGRPLARAAIKSGIIVYEKGRETLAEFGEVMEDLVAEARSEIEAGQARAGEAAQEVKEAVSTAAPPSGEPPSGE